MSLSSFEIVVEVTAEKVWQLTVIRRIGGDVAEACQAWLRGSLASCGGGELWQRLKEKDLYRRSWLA